MKKRDMGEYLFHQGTNFEAYKLLGAHVRATDSGYEYTFATWAPNASEVSVVGDFCDWSHGIAMERVSGGGIFSVTLKSDVSLEGSRYKFRIKGKNGVHLKGDPYAFSSMGGADGASLICHTSNFEWQDGAWLSYRKKTVCESKGRYLATPINIYEAHLASFMRKEDGSYLSYRELADTMVPYVKSLGFTHIELLPITEYPYDGSWGYQVCGYYAPTSRFGSPDDFRYFVNKCHTAGVGLILDWVPAHFPKDEWGLYEFDGSPLYEYQGKDRQESRSWGTRYFDVGREEVQSFLISNAIYWLEEFHIDGIRVDAVASMIYLDYDREPGEWVPNVYGDNKNLEAIAFLRKLNTAVFSRHPDTLMIAEESTSFGGITHPVSEGGLGFNLKWNMGFANDFYGYVATDPYFRHNRHTALNFPIMYAFGENYVMPISHDEVVHGKKSFVDKMFGTYEDKFSQMRAALMLIMTYPGKKMMFMGTEYAQFREWDFSDSLEWFMLDYPNHAHMREFVASLNRYYLKTPELWEDDFTPNGFEWIYPDEAGNNMVAFRRVSADGDCVTVIVSFCGRGIDNLRIPVSEKGTYKNEFCTDGGFSKLYRSKKDKNGNYITVDVPRFGAVILKKSTAKTPAMKRMEENDVL